MDALRPMLGGLATRLIEGPPGEPALQLVTDVVGEGPRQTRILAHSAKPVVSGLTQLLLGWTHNDAPPLPVL